VRLLWLTEEPKELAEHGERTLQRDGPDSAQADSFGSNLTSALLGQRPPMEFHRGRNWAAVSKNGRRRNRPNTGNGRPCFSFFSDRLLPWGCVCSGRRKILGPWDTGESLNVSRVSRAHGSRLISSLRQMRGAQHPTGGVTGFGSRSTGHRTLQLLGSPAEQVGAVEYSTHIRCWAPANRCSSWQGARGFLLAD